MSCVARHQRNIDLALINYKTIFRADYKPSLDFYDKLFPIASKLQGYPDWRTDRLTITLQDFDEQCSFSLTCSNFVYVRDLKKEQAQGQDDKRIDAILKAVQPQMQAQNYERLGLRCWFLQSVAMSFDELVSLTSERFFLQTREIKEGICPLPTDVAYVVHFDNNGLEVRLRLRPLKREEIEPQFQPDRDANFPIKKRVLSPEELFAEFPEVSLLVDADISRKSVPSKELYQTYTEAQILQSKLSQNIARYVFGKEDEAAPSAENFMPGF